MEAAEEAGEGVEEEVEFDGFGEDGEDAHAEGFVEEVVGEVVGEEDGRGIFAELFAHEFDDLEAAELGHVGVEDDGVEWGGFDEAEGFAAGTGDEGVDSLWLEKAAEGFMPSFLLGRQKHGETCGIIGLDHK